MPFDILGDLWGDKTRKHRGYNRTGATVALGSVMAMDITNSEASANFLVDGNATSCQRNLVKPATANIIGHLMVVTDLLGGGGVDDSLVECTVVGKCQALVTTGTSVGSPLSPVNASHALAVSIATDNTLAFALEANSTGSTALKTVYFDGVNGVGGYSSANPS